MEIDYGRMTEFMQIEEKTDAQGPQGAKIESWNLYANIMADFQPTRSNRLQADQQNQTLWEYEIRCPFTPGIKPNVMRVFRVDYGEYYQIDTVIDWENKHQALRLRCIRIE